jgi:aspartyl-tRNA(Asn)/glutamyl-tRNA(Gln) amidotransferase subunit A
VRSAAEIAQQVGRGELDPVAVVEEALERIAVDADLNAIMVTNGERALGRARAGVSGRLAGVPLLVKDLIDVAGLRITFGSKVYADRIAETTAPTVRALEAEGAIVVATTTCDEFAWGVGGQNVHWGDTENPLHPGRITGGSSSGNAAALAVGMGALALGTDTGGSVRLPAAGCGVVGFKTPFGALSTDGVFPLAPSLDTVGPMARTVTDCALAWSVLSGEPVPEPRLEGKRVGKLVRTPSLGEGEPGPLDPRADTLPGEPVELPVPEADVWPVFYAGAAESHRATYPARAADYGPVITAKLERAVATTPEAGRRAHAAMAAWQAAAAQDPPVDVIVSPVLGTVRLPDSGTPEEAFRIPFSAYARVFNFLGWPAIAIGETQLAARDARTLLEAALAWEASAPGVT